jgi:hypothetical protein
MYKQMTLQVPPAMKVLSVSIGYGRNVRCTLRVY